MSFATLTIADKPALVRHGSPGQAAILYLHDHDPRDLLTLERFAVGCTLIAPLGGHSLWSPRMAPAFDPARTAHDHLVHHVLPWIGSQFPGPLAIVGTGVGGQAALRIAFQHADRLPIVASINGVLDLHDWHGLGTSLDTLYERREQVRQDTAVLQIRQHAYPRHTWFGCEPASDQLRGHDRLHEKLSAVGVPHTSIVDDEPALRQHAEAFLMDAIAKQRRTLL